MLFIRLDYSPVDRLILLSPLASASFFKSFEVTCSPSFLSLERTSSEILSTAAFLVQGCGSPFPVYWKQFPQKDLMEQVSVLSSSDSVTKSLRFSLLWLLLSLPIEQRGQTHSPSSICGFLFRHLILDRPVFHSCCTVSGIFFPPLKYNEIILWYLTAPCNNFRLWFYKKKYVWLPCQIQTGIHIPYYNVT